MQSMGQIQLPVPVISLGGGGGGVQRLKKKVLMANMYLISLMKDLDVLTYFLISSFCFCVSLLN